VRLTGLSFAEGIFWFCLLLIVYSYLLYPILLFIGYSIAQIHRDVTYLASRRDRRARPLLEPELPIVSLIIPAYNEERCLPEKLANISQIAYPQSNLEVIFVSDGSTDRTNEILRDSRLANVRSIFLPDRAGKFNALNRGVAESRGEILAFCDASTLFAPDAVRMLVRHFSSPSVGGVCGAVQLRGNAESHQTEGAYWKFESMLHLMEGRLGATVTASGAIHALRRSCYQPLEPGDVIDDFLIPMRARQMGYRIRHDPEALATEFSADSVKGEFTRRVRLATGSFRALSRLGRSFPGSLAGWALFSHKVLRWVLPFLLIGVFISNLFLVRHPLYRVAFFCQLAFYCWAALGFLFRQRMQRVRYALVGYFLVAMHVAFLVGFWRYLSKQADSTWQRVN
jgi:cellulose synthase/poly-beta-1,6-N-acetylglucosamine synthase-like glycosyltransferase